MWRLSAFRALFFSLAAAGMLAAAPPPASAYELIQNGGFETTRSSAGRPSARIEAGEFRAVRGLARMR